MVPTSAVTGEGIPDLLMLLIQLSQKLIADKLLKLSNLECTVLEVRSVCLDIFFSFSLNMINRHVR